MKAFAGGQLLDERQSPFHTALSQAQCIQYALDTPGVVSVMAGVRNISDLETCLAYFNTTPAERDYSAITKIAPTDITGRCVYCNHCHPCPAGLNIALINKYYDLARLGDDLARDHYDNLEKHAADCIKCGHCDNRCPFSVAQSQRMQEIETYFGR